MVVRESTAGHFNESSSPLPSAQLSVLLADLVIWRRAQIPVEGKRCLFIIFVSFLSVFKHMEETCDKQCWVKLLCIVTSMIYS